MTGRKHTADDFKIISITDRKNCKGSFYGRIARIAEAGVSAVILREKDLSSDEYEGLALKVKGICDDAGVMFIAHSFIECAVNIGCRNIHLPLPVLRRAAGEGDLRIAGDDSGACTSGVPDSFDVIGASVHSLSEALEAQALGAAYVTAGHVFETACKPGVAPRGLVFLRKIAQALDIPVYAIGGIDSGNVSDTRMAGASGVCVMSGLMSADDVKGYVKALRSAADC